MIDERFTIKPQDDYWAVVDNYNDDKVCIINGIHTEIEAEWLCDFMNKQQATIEQLQEENDKLIQKNCIPCELVNLQTRETDKLKEENEKLRKELGDCEKFRYTVFKRMAELNDGFRENDGDE